MELGMENGILPRQANLMLVKALFDARKYGLQESEILSKT